MKRWINNLQHRRQLRTRIHVFYANFVNLYSKLAIHTHQFRCNTCLSRIIKLAWLKYTIFSSLASIYVYILTVRRYISIQIYIVSFELIYKLTIKKENWIMIMRLKIWKYFPSLWVVILSKRWHKPKSSCVIGIFTFSYICITP